MKNGHVLPIALSLLYLLITTTAFSEESLYVQPFRARIFAKPSVASEVLGSVDSGFQFVSTGKEKNWIKLQFKGKAGYLPAVQAAKTPPLGKNTVQGPDSAPKLSVRSRASSTSAVVAGMKGLTYEDRARVSKGERSDYDALDKVDALKISSDELKSFQLEGGKR